MKVGATISFILMSYGSSFGQESNSTENDENIYQVTIEYLIRTLPIESYFYISDNNGTLNLMTNRIAGREIVFVNSFNEQELLEKNGKVLRLYELEYPSVQGDIILFKINHILLFEIPLPLDELKWPERLSEPEKEAARLSIYRTEHSEDLKEALTYSSISQNSWTYVTFKFHPKRKKFKFHKIETRTI
jgi:hypothetical protein